MKKYILIILLGFAFIPSVTRAAVAVDATSSSGIIPNLTSATFSHIVSGDSRYLVCGIQGWDSVDSLTTVGFTYRGISMQKLGGQQAAANDSSILYGLLNPPTGSNTVSITGIPANYSELGAGCVSFTGVDQIVPTGTLVSNGTKTVNITLSSGDIGVDSLYEGNSLVGTPVPGVGETRQVTTGPQVVTASNKYYMMGTEPGTGTVTMDWVSTSGDTAIAAVPIKTLQPIPLNPSMFRVQGVPLIVAGVSLTVRK